MEPPLAVHKTSNPKIGCYVCDFCLTQNHRGKQEATFLAQAIRVRPANCGRKGPQSTHRDTPLFPLGEHGDGINLMIAGF